MLSKMALCAALLACASSTLAGEGYFTRNDGQWPDSILYRAEANGAVVKVTRHGLIYEFVRPIPNAEAESAGELQAELNAEFGIRRQPDELTRLSNPNQKIERYTVAREVKGASLIVEAHGESAFSSNYFIGNDESRWRIDVPSFLSVKFIDQATKRELLLSFDDRAELQQSGDLGAAIETIVAMPISARPELAISISEFAKALTFDGLCMKSAEQNSQREFGGAGVSTLSRAFSTYIGHTSDDEGRGVAIGPDGAVYVCGYSVDYDAAGLPDEIFNGDVGGSEAFVYKFGSDGSIIYRTFFGGRNTEIATDLVVNAASEVILCGYTTSPNFAGLTVGRDSARTDFDGVYVRLNNAGNGILNARYFGGTDDEYPVGIALDSSGATYVTGYTYSTDFPTRNQLATNLPDGDAFVTKFAANDTTIAYSTYLGGDRHDEANGISVDPLGAAYVCGTTYSRNFPNTRAVADSLTGADMYTAKLSPAGNVLSYAIAIRGIRAEGGDGIAVDTAGYATIIGQTSSDSAVLTSVDANGTKLALSPKIFGDTTEFDILVARVNQDGTQILYSALIGGDGTDVASGIALNAAGGATFIGTSRSTNYYLADSVSAYPDTSSGQNVVVTRLNPAGNAIIHSTYLGGKLGDFGRDIALATDGSIFLTGYSLDSTAFFTTGAYLPYKGLADGFLTRLNSTILPSSCFVGDGNVTCDGSDLVDVADLTLLVDHLFLSFASLPCPANANVDGADLIDIGDLTMLVDHLFISMAPLPGCE